MPAKKAVPKEVKKKVVVVAALAALLFALPALAQTTTTAAAGNASNVQGVVQQYVVTPVANAVKTLAYIYAVIFWASVIILAIYALIMLKAGPTTFSRWSGFVEMVDNYKRYLIGIIAVPFAIVALVTGVVAVTNASINPWDVAVSLMKLLFGQPFIQIWHQIVGS